jgi:hypothetical protein
MAYVLSVVVLTFTETASCGNSKICILGFIRMTYVFLAVVPSKMSSYLVSVRLTFCQLLFMAFTETENYGTRQLAKFRASTG